MKFKENTIFIKLAVVLLLCLIFFLLGQHSKEQEYEKQLAEITDYTTETFYFVNKPEIVDPFVDAKSDLFLEGEVRLGRCLTREGVRRFLIDKVE